MSYDVLLHPDVNEYLEEDLDGKDERICRDKLEIIENEPYPGRGRGDKEEVVVDSENVFRMHISRSYTAIYTIIEDANEVRVSELLPIDAAHKRYGFD